VQSAVGADKPISLMDYFIITSRNTALPRIVFFFPPLISIADVYIAVPENKQTRKLPNKRRRTNAGAKSEREKNDAGKDKHSSRGGWENRL